MGNKIITKSGFEKSRKIKRKLIFGIIILIIAVGAYFSFAYKPTAKTSAEKDTATSFLRLMGSETPQVAYTLTTEEYQSQIPLKDFNIMAKLQGGLKDVSVENVVGKGDFKTVSGKVTMTEGNSQVNYALDIVNVDGTWKVNRSEISNQ